MAVSCEETICGENCDKVLHIEASEAVREIKFAVNDVMLSEKLPRTDETVYLNLLTKENEEFCVELSVQGFRIVSRTYDTIDDQHESKYYETIYSLLDHVSPKYRNTFGDALMQKLSLLSHQIEDEQLEEADAKEN